VGPRSVSFMAMMLPPGAEISSSFSFLPGHFAGPYRGEITTGMMIGRFFHDQTA
jgi:hypothetical protein